MSESLYCAVSDEKLLVQHGGVLKYKSHWAICGDVQLYTHSAKCYDAPLRSTILELELY